MAPRTLHGLLPAVAVLWTGGASEQVMEGRRLGRLSQVGTGSKQVTSMVVVVAINPPASHHCW